MATIDRGILQALVEQHYLTMQKHPTEDLFLYNYTAKAQYDGHWTPETLLCRGLIVRADGLIVARPFPKFFNVEEYQGSLPQERYTVTEKWDGSLGILYFVRGCPYIATRGSFVSEQAQHATRIFLQKYTGYIESLDQTKTYLFEIIYPDNRIVVDYGRLDDLVLLAVVDTATGEEDDIYAYERRLPFPVTKRYNGTTDLAALAQLQEPNKEGFVIRFASGLRVKVKFADYVRLHRLLTQCTSRTIWDLLQQGQSFDAFLDHVPDEFYAWVKQTRDSLLHDFAESEAASLSLLAQVQQLPTRKEQAQVVTKSPYASIVFAMLDTRDYRRVLWKMLYPKVQLPFVKEAHT